MSRISPDERPDSASAPSATPVGGFGASLSADSGNPLTLTIAGRLTSDSVTRIWPQATRAIASLPPGGLRVDGSGIGYCDGSGLGLLIHLNSVARGAGKPIEFVGLSEELQSLLNRAIPAPADAPAPPLGTISRVGASTAAILSDLNDLVGFVGEIALAMVWAATHPHKIRWKDVWRTAEKVGADAVPVVCLLGWLMGLIISFQSTPVLQKFGAESMIPTMLAFAMVRELGPLVTAIILAGRTGSAFAAEIGTMKVTEEINALETFGLQPSRFLVVPRVLAAVLMTPLLSVFGTLFGLIGGYVVMFTLGYRLPFYVNQVTNAVDWVDFLQGVFKAGVFGLLVAGVGCFKGLRTKSGPGAVGDSTTRAVVMSIVLIVVADGILGVVFYFLGI